MCNTQPNMRTLTLCLLLCLPALLWARPKRVVHLESALEGYARVHPNTEYDEPECEILNEELSEANPLNAIVDRSKVWTNNVVYYQIADPSVDETQRAELKAALYDLHVNTSVDGVPCVTFVESDSEVNRVSVRNCGGTICSSYVGMIGGQQRMCLGDRCFKAHGTLMHEFLHALGYYHEHMRADRDENVFVNFDNIQAGKESNFRKLIEGVNVDHLETKYDYGSVMHYGAYGFAIDRTIPTIVPLVEGAVIGQRIALSAIDIERVQILYGCKKAADTVYFKHLATQY